MQRFIKIKTGVSIVFASMIQKVSTILKLITIRMIKKMLIPQQNMKQKNVLLKKKLNQFKSYLKKL